MVSVKIIENPMPSYLPKFEDFVDYYNNSDMTVLEIINLLGWNNGQYKKARKKAIEDGVLIPRTQHTARRSKKTIRKPKYYVYHVSNHKYCIVKKIRNKNVYFGQYDDESVTKKIVEDLKKVNWDKSLLPQIQSKYM